MGAAAQIEDNGVAIAAAASALAGAVVSAAPSADVIEDKLYAGPAALNILALAAAAANEPLTSTPLVAPVKMSPKEAALLGFCFINLTDEEEEAHKAANALTTTSTASAKTTTSTISTTPSEDSAGCADAALLISDATKRQQRRSKRLNSAKLLVIGCVLTCITNFPSAFLHTSVNTAVDELTSYLRNSYVERGIFELSDSLIFVLRSALLSCWYAGQVVGALFAPIFTDKYGRKPAYLLATAAMTFSCSLQMLATIFPYPEVLIIGRVLASMFSPMSDTVAILYLQEISPPKLRGPLSSLFATGYSAMALLGVVFGMRSVFGHSLTLLFSVPIIPGILSILFLLWLPETPKFLMINKNHRKAALKSLNFYQGGYPTDKQSILDEYAQESKNEPQENASMLSLFRVGHLRRALVIALMTMVPTLAFFPILQNSTLFFQSIHISNNFAQISSTVMTILLVLCCITAAFLLDRFPRRTLLIGFGSCSAFSLVVFSVCASFVYMFEWLKYGAVAGIFGYVICYGLAVGPISYFLAPELVPLQNRSSMFCICFSFTSVLIVITNFSTMPLFQLFGAVVMVPLFVVPTALGILYLYFYMPETKDKETHEIVDILKKRGRFHSVEQKTLTSF